MKASAQIGDGPRPGFLVRLIATGFFTGYIPFASGTFGSLAGCIVLLIPGFWSPEILWPAVAVALGAGVVTSSRMARYEGNRLNLLAAQTKALFQPGVHAHPDPSIVVIDEIVGMWISVLHLPPSIAALGIAFVLFRIFDVVKLAPARSAESIPGGWGIMLDDVVAGVYANAGARVVLYVLALLQLP
jgi:phosphatidylglycerophosphatase A